MEGLILKSFKWCWKWMKRLAVPEGYFPVFVGQESPRARFMVETDFQVLLDEAEEEYGYAYEGLLKLPCNVELFSEVMKEVQEEAVESSACNFARRCDAYWL